jgi:hypothetical protein
MTDEIDIPALLREPKPWWKEVPNETLVREILHFISRTGQPHLWPGQTYTKPPDGSTIIYLAEFDLPKSRKEHRELWAPCPCCTPRNPKYCKGGKIGYFPDESVIRILGPDCFSHINEQGHVEALRNFYAARQRRWDIAYLFANLSVVPELVEVIERAIPLATALDELRYQVRTLFDEHFRVKMWDHVRDGELRVRRFMTKPVTDSNGIEQEREVEVMETFGRIRGFAMLKPHAKRCGIRLSHSLAALKSIDFGTDYHARIEDMTAEDRRKAALLFGRALRDAKVIFEEIEDVREFTSALTIATLNGWGRADGSPLRFQVSFEGTSFYLGRDRDQFRRIAVAPEYERVLQPLPQLGLVKEKVA